ncbi:MAG: hypothetical protein ACR2NM_10310 [Bythopirellula sp.]
MRNRRHTTVLLAALIALGFSAGCARYSTVSHEAYQYSKALYSVCNRQDEPRLTMVAEQIETARAAQQLQKTEADWLTDIVATAQAGDWQDASKDARRLMEAQVVKN